MIDGALARRLKAESRTGAAIDSIADLIFIIVAAIKIIPELSIPGWLWWVIGIVAITQIIRMTFLYCKERSSSAFHDTQMTRAITKMEKEMKFCQSCGMPLSDEVLGTNADGSKSTDYCIYCYKDGAFTGDFTMEQMVDYCSTFVDQYNKNTGQNLTCCEYKEVLRKFFPSLKRWNLSTGSIPHADHPMKKVFIEEVNALGIPELYIDNLQVLPGSFINQPYTINGNTFPLFDDKAFYWGNQIEKEDGRCYGIACNEQYIVVSEYGKDGADAELVMIKRRCK